MLRIALPLLMLAAFALTSAAAEPATHIVFLAGPKEWRPDGPVARMYEREVRAEFLHSLFSAKREALHFRAAELSEASFRILQRKLDRLLADFRDLADLDAAVPSAEKRNVGCLFAMLPWVYSRFGKGTP